MDTGYENLQILKAVVERGDREAGLGPAEREAGESSRADRPSGECSRVIELAPLCSPAAESPCRMRRMTSGTGATVPEEERTEGSGNPGERERRHRRQGSRGAVQVGEDTVGNTSAAAERRR